MQFDDLLNQVEADTGSGNPGRRPGTKITLEQPGHVFGIDPHPIIADRNFDVPRFLPMP